MHFKSDDWNCNWTGVIRSEVIHFKSLLASLTIIIMVSMIIMMLIIIVIIIVIIIITMTTIIIIIIIITMMINHLGAHTNLCTHRHFHTG